MAIKGKKHGQKIQYLRERLNSSVAWAARKMARVSSGLQLDEVFTVMDADTHFTQDYFESISYH